MQSQMKKVQKEFSHSQEIIFDADTTMPKSLSQINNHVKFCKQTVDGQCSYMSLLFDDPNDKIKQHVSFKTMFVDLMRQNF